MGICGGIGLAKELIGSCGVCTIRSRYQIKCVSVIPAIILRASIHRTCFWERIKKTQQINIAKDAPGGIHEPEIMVELQNVISRDNFMPWDKSRYPRNWKEIRDRIVARSGGQCECTSECGLHRTTPGPRRCCERNGDKALFAKGKVILTVAHLGVQRADGSVGDPHDKMDVRDENLKAMCQRCHLRYDLEEHVKSAAATRRARRLAVAPTLPMMEVFA